MLDNLTLILTFSMTSHLLESETQNLNEGRGAELSIYFGTESNLKFPWWDVHGHPPNCRYHWTILFEGKFISMCPSLSSCTTFIWILPFMHSIAVAFIGSSFAYLSSSLSTMLYCDGDGDVCDRQPFLNWKPWWSNRGPGVEAYQYCNAGRIFLGIRNS